MKQHDIIDNRFAVSGLAFRIVFSCFLLVCLSGGESKAENWPTYRSDIARSGTNSETVGPELFLRWKYVPTHRPVPAWPMPAEEIPRTHIDNALRVAAADG